MIKIGVCAGPDKIEEAAELGFEYVEWGLSSICALDEAAFNQAVQLAERSPIKVEALNGMIPPEIKITGPSADQAQIRAYLSKAFERMGRLGAKIVVFGSGGARNIEENWPFEKGWRQVARFLSLAGEMAAPSGIQIAIEPLRRQESNIINLVSEAMILSSWVQSDNVGVLGDSFHMHGVNEPFSALVHAGQRLFHVHTANPEGRVFPAPGDGADYAGLFSALKAADYQGRVSVEAGYRDFKTDGALSLKALKRARDGLQ